MIDGNAWYEFLLEIENYNVNAIKLRVNTNELNVRAGSGTNYPIKRKLKQDDIVTKLEQSGQWYRIGVDEWIHGSYVIMV